jgi:hypothetical protein
MVADKWKHENAYEIIVNNTKPLIIGLEQTLPLQAVVEVRNTLRNVAYEMETPIFTYAVEDDTILDVQDDGIIVPEAEGSTFVDIKLMSGDTEKAEIITSKRIEITVSNGDIDILPNSRVEIKGDSTIFFDSKSKYTVALYQNGLPAQDTFIFELLNEINTPVSSKVAGLLNIQNDSCEIQAFSHNAEIKLIARAQDSDVEGTMQILIRDIL